ncbi:hypothetical protein ACFO5R_18905 [Halosolutus amylolyticus]|uniref:Uncharacterized protein n=1 Tax=Halosolutus amylolyticus TaxID=2932267 RepID=A0ABD5PTV9_9EURY|nr:hypothetical protein [Halosolutus amylolyticus]
MVRYPLEVSTRLVSHARTAFSFGETPDDRTPASGVDRDKRTERRRSPRILELDGEELPDDLDDFEGVIGLLRAEEDSDLIKEFERAVRDADPDRIRRVHKRLETAARTENEDSGAVADLTYHSEPVISELGLETESAVAADFAAFTGGDLDRDAFEVREYAATDDAEYEYQVVVVSPTKSEAERDAAALAPETVQEPSLKVQPSEASAVTLVAAGAVLGAAAVYSSGSADNAVNELDSRSVAAVEEGASVDALVDTRKQLHG